MTILYVLAALLMLGIMVTVHEAGHFFAARLTGIPVKQFAIGFGPKILQWKNKKHETEFSLRLIPAGGFCAFYGEDDTEGKEAKDPRALQNYNVWKRMLTIIMGPVMNFVLAFVVCVVFVAVSGVTNVTYGDRATISGVTAGGAADLAGFEPGDIFVSVNGEDARGVSEDGQKYLLSELLDRYSADGAPLTVVVERAGEQKSLSVTPVVDENGKAWLNITISPEVLSLETIHLSAGDTIATSWNQCVAEGSAILTALKNLVFKGEGADQMGGPVAIVQMITEETQAYGLSAYISLLIFISVNLGLVNLLPIPGLDGSRVVFLLIEAVRGKPVPQKIEAYIHMAGFFLLIGLFLVLTWNDIAKLF